jgi:predicted nucleic acid-binding protein
MNEMKTAKAIYLDVCALGRPYDKQEQPRIIVETTAVSVITANVKAGLYTMYYSPVHYLEINDNPKKYVRTEIKRLFRETGRDIAEITDDDAVTARARELIKGGLKGADAFHVAYAEAANAMFISCDDVALRKCASGLTRLWHGTPVDFCRKKKLL